MRNPFTHAATLAALAVAALRAESLRIFNSPMRDTFFTPGAAGRTGRTYKPNGQRECARRRRQIAAGILTTSNGLIPENRAL